MGLIKGAGTCSSPFAIDSDYDSESEVQHNLTNKSSRSTSFAGSPQLKNLRLDSTGQEPQHEAGADSTHVENPSVDTEYRPQFHNTNDDHVRGTKRQRSASVMSRDSQASPAPDPEHDGQPSANSASGRPGESRKARKRRRKAEKAREVYLERLNRLTHNPDLQPQYPPGIDPFLIANLDPMAFLPQLHTHLASLDFGLSPAYYAQQQQNQWNDRASMNGYNPPSHEEYGPGWSISAATLYQNYSTVHPSAMAVDPPPSAATEFQAISTKPPQTIGVEPDNDPNSKHGLFNIPDGEHGKDGSPYLPTPACTLVLEQLPKTHRVPNFINAWSQKATGVTPVKVLIDGSGAKALVEFPSADAARAAWGSPRLGIVNLGLKPHLLKGRPREDLIKAYWYRVDGVSAGVGEIEEGEIEEVGEKGSTLQRKETKKEKKSRLEKQRQEKQRRDLELRLARDDNGHPTVTSGSMPLLAHVPNRPALHTTALPLNSGLPPRPANVPPSDVVTRAFPPPSVDNGPRAPVQANQSLVKDSDDMDLGSPPSPGPVLLPPPLIPNPSVTRAHAYVPTAATAYRNIPSEPRAMKHTPTEPSHHKRALEQKKREAFSAHHPPNVALRGTAPEFRPSSVAPSPPPTGSNVTEVMEASLREKVLRSRKTAARSQSREEISPTGPGQAPASTSNTGSNKAASMDAADSFIAATLGNIAGLPYKPPPPSQPTARSTLETMKAELAERLQRAEKEVEALREKNRSRKDEEQRERHSSSTAPGPMKPSAKINLDYVPTKSPTEYFWPNAQASTIVIVSDDEYESGDDEEDGQDY